MSVKSIVSPDRIEGLIYFIRGQKVMLDTGLSALYGVEARVLNQAVKRNIERFPSDFMFQLSKEETLLVMRSQVVTSSPGNSSQSVMSPDVTGSKSTKTPLVNSSQFATSSRKHRGLAYRPFAFTEQGVAMLSSVLHSSRAVQVNIEIMRAFVRLRQMLASNAELARKLDALEKKYDEQFKIVFEAIRQLMEESEPVTSAPREMGFHAIPSKQSGKAKGVARALAR